MRQELAHSRLLRRSYNNVRAQRKIDRECNLKNKEKVEQLQKDSEAIIQEAMFPVSLSTTQICHFNDTFSGSAFGGDTATE
jgi:hypothetical protein